MRFPLPHQLFTDCAENPRGDYMRRTLRDLEREKEKITVHLSNGKQVEGKLFFDEGGLVSIAATGAQPAAIKVKGEVYWVSLMETFPSSGKYVFAGYKPVELERFSKHPEDYHEKSSFQSMTLSQFEALMHFADLKRSIDRSTMIPDLQSDGYWRAKLTNDRTLLVRYDKEADEISLRVNPRFGIKVNYRISEPDLGSQAIGVKHGMRYLLKRCKELDAIGHVMALIVDRATYAFRPAIHSFSTPLSWFDKRSQPTPFEARALEAWKAVEGMSARTYAELWNREHLTESDIDFFDDHGEFLLESMIKSNLDRHLFWDLSVAFADPDVMSSNKRLPSVSRLSLNKLAISETDPEKLDIYCKALSLMDKPFSEWFVMTIQAARGFKPELSDAYLAGAFRALSGNDTTHKLKDEAKAEEKRGYLDFANKNPGDLIDVLRTPHISYKDTLEPW